MSLTDNRSRSRLLLKWGEHIGLHSRIFKEREPHVVEASRQFCRSIEWWCLGWIIGCSSLLLFSQFPPRNYILTLVLLALVFRKHFNSFVFLPILCSLLWSSWIMFGHWEKQLPRAIEGVNVEVSGQIEGLPSYKSSHTQFRFRVMSLTSELSETELSSNPMVGELIQLSCYRCPWDLQPEQRWHFTVRLKRPHGYASWGAFDYEKYLFRHLVLAKGYIRVKNNNSFISQESNLATRMRWKVSLRLRETLGDYPLGQAILSALLVGDKSGLGNKHKEVFQATGVSHLLAISGLHIGLVFGLVAMLCRWCLFPFARIYNWVPRQRLVLLPGLIAAVSYSALAGFSVSTQRAIIMLSVYVFSRLVGREISLMQVLVFAAALILLIDPSSVLDAGYWLSCVAVFVIALSHYAWGNLSLIRLQPLLWLGMMPLTLIIFGQVSLVSPIVNLIIVPLFCVVLIPLALVSLASWSIGLHDWSLILMQNLASIFERIFLLLESVSNWSLALFYPTYNQLFIAVMLVVALLLTFQRRCLFAIAALVLSINVFLSDSFPEQDGYHEIILLDVGQGLSMVVLVKDYALVYDTGPAYLSGFNATEAVLIPYLRRRGIREIDTLIISHADNDHIGGLPYLRAAFPISEILSSRLDKVSDAQPCLSGQKWTRSGVTFEMLGPDLETPQGSNNLSCVLRVSNKKFRTLISGDIEKQVERYMLASNVDLRADILLVPHQGSKTSSTGPFIRAVNPALGLVAAGYRNHYGHPHSDVVKRYAQNRTELKSTIESGSILLKINNNSVSESSFRKSKQGVWHREKKPKWKT